jgi:hypothetical protein
MGALSLGEIGWGAKLDHTRNFISDEFFFKCGTATRRYTTALLGLEILKIWSRMLSQAKM